MDIEQEIIMMSEEDYNAMVYDIAYLDALVDIMTERFIEEGIEILIPEDEIVARIRKEESGEESLN